MLNNSEASRSKVLARTNIVGIDGRMIDVPVNVIFDLFPSPRVVIETDTLAAVLPNPNKERFQIELGNGARLEVLVHSLSWTLHISSRVSKRIYQSVVQSGRDFPYIRVGGGQ